MAQNVGQLNLDTAPQQSTASRWGRLMLNKVPEITIFFWLIKVLCTTVGETAADLLNETLNLGLSGTSVVMGVMLIIVLFFQFRARRYIPSVYWLAVVLLSIVGTLITDNLVDTYEVPLETTTIIFGVALIVTFVAWYASEGTLSIHHDLHHPTRSLLLAGHPFHVCPGHRGRGPRRGTIRIGLPDFGPDFWRSDRGGHDRSLRLRPGRCFDLLDRLHSDPAAGGIAG